MKYVVDTNVIAALMRGDSGVIARLRRVQKAHVILPQPVLAEIAYGIQRLSASRRKQRLVEAFEAIQTELGRAEWDDAVSHEFGRIKAELEQRGEPIGDMDVAVAAHAAAASAVLVTANLRHFRRVPGLRVENWIETSA